MNTHRSLIITAPLGGNKAAFFFFSPKAEEINPKNRFPDFSFPVDAFDWEEGWLAELQDGKVLSKGDLFLDLQVGFWEVR